MSTLLKSAQTLEESVSALREGAGAKQIDAAFLRDLRDVTQQIKSLIAEFDEPVRVGVVGAFSSGKTRLIEALLGCAGRLNVGEAPSTGNIVEFQLARTSAEQTRFGELRVVFMHERNGAAPLVERLLKRAQGLIDAETSLRRETRQLLAETMRDGLPLWSNCQEWAKLTHQECRGNELKSLAFEVYRLAYTVGQAREWLGKTFTISESQAIELMSLSYKPDEVYKTPLEAWRTHVPETPDEPRLPEFDKTKLRALFPIIAKLEIRVELPPHVVAELGESILQVRLVDCPGAGADGSSYRDEMLCAAELANVDTVLVLLSGKSPGQKREFLDGLLQVWGPTAKDRILVVVSRFDSLPHNQDRDQGKLAEFAQAKTPLTAAETLSAFPSLRVLFEASRDTVMDRNHRRIAFVSAMAFLTGRLIDEQKAAWGLSSFYRHDMHFDPETTTHQAAIADILQQPRSCVQEMPLWHAVGERLKLAADEESQQLSELLRGYAVDGGFSRMMDNLNAHLDRHGRLNQLQRLERKLEKCERQVKSLQEQLAAAPDPTRSIPTTAAGNLPNREAAICALRLGYERLQSELPRKTYDLGRVRGDQLLPIKDLLRRNLIHRIFSWREWSRLLERLERDNTVRLVDPNDLDVARLETLRKRELETPTNSQDFLAPFQRTLDWCERIIHQHHDKSFQYYHEGLKSDLTTHLGGRVRAAALNDSLDESQQSWLTVGSSDPPVAPHSEDNANAVAFFPLQNSSRFYYAWHAPLQHKYPSQFANRHRHLMYVVRLRQTLVDAAIAWMETRLRERDALLAELIRDRVETILEAIASEAERIAPATGKAGGLDDELIDD